MPLSTPAVKERHLDVCLSADVRSDLTTGFEKYRFLHNALPEINRDDIDLSLTFLGKRLKAPILISPMTGGTPRAEAINRNLALVAQELGLAMAVGSQRAALEDPSLDYSYKVRDIAPDILLLGNLGAVHLNHGFGVGECRRAVDMIGADALSLYLNPLQEALQLGGKTRFAGLASRIADICQNLKVPVMVKEVGFGLSPRVAAQLEAAGAAALDVAGAGGTSWAKVERLVAGDGEVKSSGRPFDDWGIPTAEALVSVAQAVRGLPLVASGGIRTGLDIAKGLALGATLAGVGLPLLKPATESAESVKQTLLELIETLKTAMLCLGVRNLQKLSSSGLVKD